MNICQLKILLFWSKLYLEMLMVTYCSSCEFECVSNKHLPIFIVWWVKTHEEIKKNNFLVMRLIWWLKHEFMQSESFICQYGTSKESIFLQNRNITIFYTESTQRRNCVVLIWCDLVFNRWRFFFQGIICPF